MAISVVAGAGVASLAVVAALVFRIFSGWSRMQADSVDGLQLNGAPLVWRRVDDIVMGGRSSSALRSDRGGLVFSGSINTNGGGFASWRGRSRSGGPILSADTTALRVRLKGDGKCYKITLGSGGGGPFSGKPTWQADVETSAKATTEIEIPLKSFVPSMRGQPVSGHVLRPAEMLEVGLMLSLYKAGGQKNPEHTFGDGIFPFEARLEAIEAV